MDKNWQETVNKNFEILKEKLKEKKKYSVAQKWVINRHNIASEIVKNENWELMFNRGRNRSSEWTKYFKPGLHKDNIYEIENDNKKREEFFNIISEQYWKTYEYEYIEYVTNRFVLSFPKLIHCYDETNIQELLNDNSTLEGFLGKEIAQQIIGNEEKKKIFRDLVLSTSEAQKSYLESQRLYLEENRVTIISPEDPIKSHHIQMSLEMKKQRVKPRETVFQPVDQTVKPTKINNEKPKIQLVIHEVCQTEKTVERKVDMQNVISSPKMEITSELTQRQQNLQDRKTEKNKKLLITASYMFLIVIALFGILVLFMNSHNIPIDATLGSSKNIEVSVTPLPIPKPVVSSPIQKEIQVAKTPPVPIEQIERAIIIYRSGKFIDGVPISKAFPELKDQEGTLECVDLPHNVVFTNEYEQIRKANRDFKQLCLWRKNQSELDELTRTQFVKKLEEYESKYFLLFEKIKKKVKEEKNKDYESLFVTI